MSRAFGLYVLFWFAPLMAHADVPVTQENRESAERYLQAVSNFADKVLEHGYDVYGPKKTPLFVDGINVDTLEPPVWVWKGKKRVLSNQATQQNLFRALVGLSAATGDPKYRQAAVDAVRYAFGHLQDGSGLLYWGGHAYYDALEDKAVSGVHELKHHYPYYELMWQVDPGATRRFIEAVWDAHVLRWENLDVNRHGSYGRTIGKLWDHDYQGGPVYFDSKGLSFMMSGTDFFCAAALLSHFSGDEKPLVWASRLAKRYVEARHPETGLGASNFSVPYTHRMRKQFPQFDGRFTEATVTDIYGSRYSYGAICQLKLGETLGSKGRDFLRWGIEDLTARATHGYDESTNTFAAMLIDGTVLTPADRKKEGYVKVEWLEPRMANSRHFYAYALAYKLSGKELMWRMVRSIGRGLDLGDLGAAPGKPQAINRQTSNNDSLVIFGLLELFETTRENEYRKLAKRVADNILVTRIHNGFFVASKNHIFSCFDDVASLALLHMRAVLLELPERPPAYWGGRGFYHGYHDDKGRTYDHRVIYNRLRAKPATVK
ncbi:MAG: pectate lyase [Planctomycetota bacterium]|nr:MAG: pectate lyase [Planctomycetota bacterium]